MLGKIETGAWCLLITDLVRTLVMMNTAMMMRMVVMMMMLVVMMTMMMMRVLLVFRNCYHHGYIVNQVAAVERMIMILILIEKFVKLFLSQIR